MDMPKYFIMNPLQLILKKEICEISERFNKKMEKLKNINLQNKKYKNYKYNEKLLLVCI